MLTTPAVISDPYRLLLNEFARRDVDVCHLLMGAPAQKPEGAGN
jgi:hypothetical protein